MDHILREEIYQLHAEICGALADPIRILILYRLAEAPHNVSDLASGLGFAQPTISRHLKVLRDRDMVASHREGQAVVYAITDQRIIEALDLLRAVLAARLTSRADLARSVSEARA